MNRWFVYLLAGAIVFSLVAPNSELRAAQDEKKSSDEKDSLVTDIGPGKRLYGQKPEFADIGHATMFDLSPEGDKIAFNSHKGVRFWDVKKGKLVELAEEEPGNHNPGQHFEYSADGLKLFVAKWKNFPVQPTEQEEGDETPPQPTTKQAQVIEVRSAVTGEVIGTVEPKPDKNEHRHMSLMLPSPDGDKVLVGFGQQSELYDVETGERLHEFKSRNWMQAAAFDNDGKRLFDGNGRIIDVETGESDGKLPRMIFGQYLSSIKFHPKRNLIAAAEWSKGIRLYDLDEKEKIELEESKTVRGQQMQLMEFSPDGELLACSTTANWQTQKGKPTIVVWDVQSGKVVDEIEHGGGNIARMRFTPDNKFIFTKAHSQYGLSRFEIDGDHKKSSARLTNPIQSFQFTDSDERVVACPQQGEAFVFDIETGESTGSISNQNTTHMELSGSGKYAVLASNYRNVKIHNIETGKTKNVEVKSFSRPSMVARLGGFLTGKKQPRLFENYSIGSVTVSEDDDHILVSLRGNHSFRWQMLQIKDGKTVAQEQFKYADYWDTEDESLRNQIRQYNWMPGSTAVSPNGQYYALIGPDKKIMVIDAESGDELFDFAVENFRHSYAKMFFSRDSSKLFVKAGDKLRLFDVESGEEANELKIGGNSYRFGLSQDRTKAAFVKNNPQEIVVYDLETEEELFTKKTKVSYVGIGISDDGEKLALARRTAQFEIWNLNELED